MSSTSTQNPTKTLIAQNYNKIAQKYTEWASTSPSSRLKYLNLALTNLNPNSRILELGSGAGTPVLEALISHPKVSKVYANDISSSQLALAKELCPAAQFLEGDMLDLSFEEEEEEEVENGNFDAVVAFFTIFHLPRHEQKMMLQKVYRWMKKGAFLVMNFGTLDQEELRDDFFGEDMFWSSFGPERNLAILSELGFEVLKSEVLGSGENLKSGDTDYGIEFLWVFARKGGE